MVISATRTTAQEKGPGRARMGALQLSMVTEGLIKTVIFEKTKVSEERLQSRMRVSRVTPILKHDLFKMGRLLTAQKR